MPEDFSFAKKDEFGKINLNYQINRTAIVLSQTPDAGSLNILRSQKMLVKTKMNAVKTLEGMLQYYIKNEGKMDELEKLKRKYNLKIESLSENDAMIAKEKYAEELFGFLMEFISKKGWFIEDITEDTIGGADDYNTKVE